jgi:hypothetical protein
MKMKNIILTIAATLGTAASNIAQINCNVINSATFCAEDTVLTPQAYVHHLGNNTLTTINLNQWHYIVMTKNTTGNGQLFLDGQLMYTGDYSSISYNWNRIDLGARFYTQYEGFFNGYIDELRVSNIVKTSNEIQDSYSSFSPFSLDENTIGLYHFDQDNGSTLSASTGPNGNLSNATWNNNGIFGGCLFFNGINTYGTIPLNIPENDLTIEVWFKAVSMPSNIWAGNQILTTYGFNTGGIGIFSSSTTPNYEWSTGETTNCVTVDPSTLPYLWVNDGNCTDTIWFNSQSSTIYDTTFVSVTDTLIINTLITGIFPQDNSNTIKIFPNPANSNITIDYGNFAIMNGYQLKIQNSIGQQVFQTNITQQTDYLSLNNWGGNGLYFVHIIDPQGNTIDIRKIVLQ